MMKYVLILTLVKLACLAVVGLVAAPENFALVNSPKMISGEVLIVFFFPFFHVSVTRGVVVKL